MAAVPAVRANYYGKISLIDDRIGCILDAFQRRGWLEDLFIIFLADHGEMLGDHGRFRKGTFHESSIRIPFIMRLPGRIPAQTVTDALVENIDVFPTVLEAAGCTPSARCLGRSLWPVLQRTVGESRESQLCEVEHHSEQQIMIRTRRHKLAVDNDWRGYMLYDLAHDPCEQHNLAGDPAAHDLEEELRGQLRARLTQSRFGS
jgi:arylsulfatase A-like enzyme